MADKTTVDTALGTGTWDDWRKILREKESAAKGSEDWDHWFSLGADADLVWRCRDDIILLDMVADDYAEALNRAIKATLDQLRKVRVAFGKAVALLAGDNLIINTMREAGIPRSLTALKLGVLREQSARAKNAVAAAQKAIAAARASKNKAEAQAYLDVADTIVKAAFPEIALAEKIVLGLGKWAMGKYLLDLSEPAEEGGIDTLLSFKTLRDYKAGLAHPGVQITLDAEKIFEDSIAGANAWLAMHNAEIEVDKLARQIASRKSLLVTLKGNVRDVEIKCFLTRSTMRTEVDVALTAAGYNLATLYLNWR